LGLRVTLADLLLASNDTVADMLSSECALVKCVFVAIWRIVVGVLMRLVLS